MSTPPRVRVVVLNFDGGSTTLRCLDGLRRLDWPAEALEVVVVDNASVDGLLWTLRSDYPEVRVIESLTNEGFARGCNLGMADLDGVDYVALLNNDAVPDPGWLRPLVEALEADPRVGAAASKILFADQVLAVTLTSPAFVPGGADRRRLGVTVSGARLNGRDAWPDLVFDEGWYGEEPGVGREPGRRWSRDRATVMVRVHSDQPDDSLPRTLSLRLAAERAKTVTLTTEAARAEVEVDTEPQWVDVDLDGHRHDVVNNAGSGLFEGGYGGDLGFRELDRGQWDEPAEVFAWCGGAVLLRKEYLEEVGRFDPRYFLYYEDTDLSWRGRLRGWRYRYVPASLVRHDHAFSSGEGSDFFRYWVDRNRLVTLVKLAPWPLTARAVAVYIRETARIVRQEVVGPLGRLRRPHPHLSRQRMRSLLSAGRTLPYALTERRRIRQRRVVGDDEIVAWTVRR